MSDVVEKFGSIVDSRVEEKPDSARNLLLAAYRGKLFMLKHFPDRRLPKSRDMMAVASMNAIIEGLAHPENSALVSIFAPCEILQALGIHPMLAEAMASYVKGADAERGFIDYAQQRGIPETYCSYHKVLLGECLSGVIRKPRMIFNTSLVCDANNLTFSAAAKHYGVPHYYVDVPYDTSEESVQYVAEQLRDFVPFAEELCGKKMDMDVLKEHVRASDRTMRNLAAVQKKKRGRYLSNDITDEMYEVFANHVLIGTPEIEQFSRQLLSEVDHYEAFDGIRLLWMHTIPFYQKPLRELLNFNREIQIVACDMNFDEYCATDPEKPFEAMAKRLVTDSFNGPSDRRIDRAIAMCKKLDIDGVVYFCHWGCKQTMGASQNAKKMLEDAGYPTLILDGDGCDARNASDGQTATRMGAFVEMLKARKS